MRRTASGADLNCPICILCLTTYKDMDIFQVQESRKCLAVKEVKLITSVGTRTIEEAMPPIAPAACNQLQNIRIAKIEKKCQPNFKARAPG